MPKKIMWACAVAPRANPRMSKIANKKPDFRVRDILIFLSNSNAHRNTPLLLELRWIPMPGMGTRPPILFQMLREELGAGRIRGQPVAMQQEIVDLVGEDQFLDIDLLFAQRLGELRPGCPAPQHPCASPGCR